MTGEDQEGSQRVLAAGAPAPVGPYSQAIRSRGFLFCSGQVAIDPASGKLIEGGVEAQTRRVMANLAAVLDAAGTSFERVVKTTIFLVDMDDFVTVNRVYGTFFGEVAPARSTVAVAALPLGARIEIEAVAELSAAAAD
jgi:2-iminobutanoate/2-iminopropanoate deaminase